MSVVRAVARTVFAVVFGALLSGTIALLTLETAIRRRAAERAGGTIEWI